MNSDTNLEKRTLRYIQFYNIKYSNKPAVHIQTQMLKTSCMDEIICLLFVTSYKTQLSLKKISVTWKIYSLTLYYGHIL